MAVFRTKMVDRSASGMRSGCSLARAVASTVFFPLREMPGGVLYFVNMWYAFSAPIMGAVISPDEQLPSLRSFAKSCISQPHSSLRCLKLLVLFVSLGAAQSVPEQNGTTSSSTPSPMSPGFDVKWWVCGSVLLLELVLGFFYWRWACFLRREKLKSWVEEDVKHEDSWVETIGFCTMFFHFALLFSPYLWLLTTHVPIFTANPVFAANGLVVSCHEGLPWICHIVYAAALVLSTPVMGPNRDGTGLDIPLLGGKGTLSGEVYLYVMTLFNNFDQYSDNMAASVAIACGWPYAWALVAVFFVSFIIQAIVIGQFAGAGAAFGFVMGVLPNPAEVQSAMSIEDTASRLKEAKRFQASAAITKFFTEVVPQASLQITFVVQTKPSYIVYASITLSCLMALKACMTGIDYICHEDEDEDEDDDPDESQE